MMSISRCEMESIKPRSAFYDGRLYAALVEPFQGSLHRKIEELIEPGSTVLDACCGTGALLLRLAGKCRHVTGVDLSPRQIEFAEHRRRVKMLGNVTFEGANATDLRRWPDRTFDIATLVLALHEMPTEERVATLCELARVSKRTIVVDYAVPLPRSLVGLLAWIVEMGAGPRHFAGFREFCRRGGLGALVEQAGLEIVHRERLEGNVLALCELK